MGMPLPVAGNGQTNASVAANGSGRSAPTSLIDVLVAQGALRLADAQTIKTREIQTGRLEEELLREDGRVGAEQLARAKAALYNVPFVDLDQTPVSPEALSLIDQTVAIRFKAVPVSIDKDSRQLTLAMADPLDIEAVEFVTQKTGFRVRPVAAVPDVIERVLHEQYAVGLSEGVTEAIKEAQPVSGGVNTVDLSNLDQVIREAPIAKIVKELLTFAVGSRASDIHTEPEEKNTRIRYRIDGILQEKFSMSRQLHESLISRIKILSGMKIDERRIPQDGRFNFKAGGEEVDLRVSSLPTVFGEKIVMRLLKKSGGVPKLPELGLRGGALKNLEDAILRPHGIIIICGPTGSGKTTTLYSILSKVSTPKVNVVTLEDPVEYQIPGVNQVQVNPVAGLTFASGLRAFLRQDPNVIMVGEIRDAETAGLATQAALTGHLVFSTLHTNDSSGVLPRLLDMGIEPFLITSTITCVVAQRVLRRIHEECKQPYKPDETAMAEIKSTLGKLWPRKEGEEVELYRGMGDEECASSGYRGRVGIYEVMPVSEKIGRLVLEKAAPMDIGKQAVEEGMITMKQDGYLKVLEGVTTMEEVLRVAQD